MLQHLLLFKFPRRDKMLCPLSPYFNCIVFPPFFMTSIFSPRLSVWHFWHFLNLLALVQQKPQELVLLRHNLAGLFTCSQDLMHGLPNTRLAMLLWQNPFLLIHSQTLEEHSGALCLTELDGTVKAQWRKCELHCSNERPGRYLNRKYQV